MATPTANYGFVKDAPSQNYDVGVVNANLDSIDTEIKARADDIADLSTSNTDLDGRLDALEAATPMCRLTMTAPQIISSAVLKNIDFATATAVETLPGMNGKALDRISCKRAGYYIATLRTVWDEHPTGFRSSFIKLNVAGTTIAEEYRISLGGSIKMAYMVSTTPIKMAVDDYVYAAVQQSSPDSLGLEYLNGSYSWFQLTMVAGP